MRSQQRSGKLELSPPGTPQLREDFYAIGSDLNHSQVCHRLKSTKKSAARSTDGYTK